MAVKTDGAGRCLGRALKAGKAQQGAGQVCQLFTQALLAFTVFMIVGEAVLQLSDTISRRRKTRLCVGQLLQLLANSIKSRQATAIDR